MAKALPGAAVKGRMTGDCGIAGVGTVRATGSTLAAGEIPLRCPEEAVLAYRESAPRRRCFAPTPLVDELPLAPVRSLTAGLRRYDHHSNPGTARSGVTMTPL